MSTVYHHRIPTLEDILQHYQKNPHAWLIYFSSENPYLVPPLFEEKKVKTVCKYCVIQEGNISWRALNSLLTHRTVCPHKNKPVDDSVVAQMLEKLQGGAQGKDEAAGAATETAPTKEEETKPPAAESKRSATNTKPTRKVKQRTG